MNHFNAVCQIHRSIVHPSRHGMRLVAVFLAAVVGFLGHWMETSPQFSPLDMGDVVEQIHTTLERRESVKGIHENLNSFSRFIAA